MGTNLAECEALPMRAYIYGAEVWQMVEEKGPEPSTRTLPWPISIRIRSTPTVQQELSC